MKQLKEMPEEGQFTAHWTYDNTIWSGTFKWEDDVLHEYSDYSEDYWMKTEPYFAQVDFSDVTYFVK